MQLTDEADWGYVSAAAVLSSFDPETIQPVDGGEPETALLASLLDKCRVIYDADGSPRWRLRSAVRREALRQLATRGLISRALEANPHRPDDGLQRAFDAQILGAVKPVAMQSSYELAQTLQVSEWLHGVLDGVPDPAEVRRALDGALLLDPLRALVGDHFRGRKRELKKLHDYVGGGETEPLVIHGGCGVGKSTVLAKLILDVVETPGDESVPFAYLDFDRPEIVAEEPATILVEAARQLGIQQERWRDLWNEFRSKWNRELGAPRRSLARPRKSSAGDLVLGEGSQRAACILDFSRRIARVTDPDVPLLLALDSTEKIQLRGHDFVVALWSFLEELASDIPSVRIIAAGRTELDGPSSSHLELKKLDHAAAVGFLEARGVRDPKLADAIASHVGGHPLTLELAAEVAGQEMGDVNAVTTVPTKKYFLLSINQERIQRELYSRILSRVDDPDVRKLAYTGLLLRRMTPEVVLRVLALPCEIEVGDVEAARRLVDALGREDKLVRRAADGALEHRPDVRVALLPLLRQDRPDVVEAIHRAAVAYYMTEESLVARAEEIYHRLALDEEADVIDSRWLPGIEPRLYVAVHELPPRAMAYLASKLGLAVDDKVLRHATLADHERRTSQRVHDLLELGDLERATAVLTSQRERAPDSELHLLEAIVWRQRDELERAAAAVQVGLDSMSEQGPTALTLELLGLSGELRLQMGDPSGASERLGDAYAMARRLNDPARMLDLGAAWLRAKRYAQGTPVTAADPAAIEVGGDLDRLPDEVLAGNPTLAYDLAGELGEADPPAIVRVARAVAAPPSLPATEIVRALMPWDEELGGTLSETVEFVALTAESETRPSSRHAWRGLARLLEEYSLTPSAASLMAAALRDRPRSDVEPPPGLR